jgi:AcrR family transcriptional regulator
MPERHFQQARARETFERIRRETIRAFAAQGPHKARISEIVERAGVTQPTFYQCFSGKMQAYEELLSNFRLQLDTLNTSLRMRVDPEETRPYPARVAASIGRILDFLAEDRDLTEIGFFQEPGASESRAVLIESIKRNIAAEQAIGLVRADIDAHRIAQIYVAIISTMARERENEEQRPLRANDCAIILCEGLAPHENLKKHPCPSPDLSRK